MTACPEHALDLTLHATGALDADAAARLEGHLGQCAACRAALAEERTLLGELAAARPFPAEDAALAALPERTLVAWQRARTRRLVRRRALGTFAAIAASAALVLWTRGGTRSPEDAAPASAPAVSAVSDETLEAFHAWSERGPLATELVSTLPYDEDATATSGVEDEDALVVPAADLDLYPEEGATR